MNRSGRASVHAAQLPPQRPHQAAGLPVADPLAEIVQPRRVAPPASVPVAHALDRPAEPGPGGHAPLVGHPGDGQAGLHQRHAVEPGERQRERLDAARPAAGAEVGIEGAGHVGRAGREPADARRGHAGRAAATREPIGAQRRGPVLEAGSVGPEWKAGRKRVGGEDGGRGEQRPGTECVAASDERRQVARSATQCARDEDSREAALPVSGGRGWGVRAADWASIVRTLATSSSGANGFWMKAASSGSRLRARTSSPV